MLALNLDRGRSAHERLPFPSFVADAAVGRLKYSGHPGLPGFDATGRTGYNQKKWSRLECWGGKKRLSALFPLAALGQDLSRLSATVPTVGSGGAACVTRFDKLRFRT